MLILVLATFLSLAETKTPPAVQAADSHVGECPPGAKKSMDKTKKVICKIKEKDKWIVMSQDMLDKAWELAALPGAMPPSFNKLFAPKGDKIKALELDQADHCLLTESGKMKCWGENLSGSIGNNSTTKSLTPVELDLKEIRQVKRKGDTTCALINPGFLKCWGGFFDDTIKEGDITRTLEHEKVLKPVELKTPGLVEDFSLGNDFKCIVSEGKAYCSGHSPAGELGNGDISSDFADWLEVKGLNKGVSKITSGVHHSCALLDSGKLKCWGKNAFGVLGTADTKAQGPVDIAGLDHVKGFGLGDLFSCALNINGTVFCWGNSDYVGIGEEKTKTITTPTIVKGLESGVSQLSVREESACALLISGEVKCWGKNDKGQLGDGTRERRTVPVTVKNLEGVGLISVGINRSCALQTDNKLKCWGQSPVADSSKVVINEVPQEIFPGE